MILINLLDPVGKEVMRKKLRVRETGQKWRENHREYYKAWSAQPHVRAREVERTRRYRAANPDKTREGRRKYGYLLSIEQFNAMLAEQRGVCAVCGKPSPKERRLQIDHCHITGKVRGLLCFNCNAAMGHVKDSPERLRALADYLERSRS